MALPNVRTNLGDVRTHTLRVAEEITHRWTLYYVWGIGGSGHHAAGRALDFMTLTANQSAWRPRLGREIAMYLRRNHRRLGVQYIIYQRRIWNATRSDDRGRVEHREWRWMEDRGNPTDNHMDHVHVSFRNNPPAYRPPADQEDDVELSDKFEYHGRKVRVSTWIGRAALNAEMARHGTARIEAQLEGLSEAVKALAQERGVDGDALINRVGQRVDVAMDRFEAKLGDAEVVLEINEAEEAEPVEETNA